MITEMLYGKRRSVGAPTPRFVRVAAASPTGVGRLSFNVYQAVALRSTPTSAGAPVVFPVNHSSYAVDYRSSRSLLDAVRP